MKRKIKSKVIVPHKENCFMKNDKYPFSGLVVGHYWGNWNATPSEKLKTSASHIWHKITCNDPNCPAIKAVHNSVLIQA